MLSGAPRRGRKRFPVGPVGMKRFGVGATRRRSADGRDGGPFPPPPEVSLRQRRRNVSGDRAAQRMLRKGGRAAGQRKLPPPSPRRRNVSTPRKLGTPERRRNVSLGGAAFTERVGCSVARERGHRASRAVWPGSPRRENVSPSKRARTAETGKRFHKRQAVPDCDVRWPQ